MIGAEDTGIDLDTLELDAQLTTELELRARLAAAIADNQALQLALVTWKAASRRWEQRANRLGYRHGTR